MKTIILAMVLGYSITLAAQDSTMAITESEKKPVQIFSSEKTINANTTETTGKGKMGFKVSHNFGDIGGTNGGLKNFFGLDVSTDIRIGFNIGIGDRFDLIAARAKGGIVQQLWELGFKYQLLQQYDDNSHPLAIAIFANTVISTEEKGHTGPESDFQDFGDRLSNVVQLILARKFGKVSLQLNPTYSRRGMALPYDQTCFFALGGAIRVPVISNRLNLVADYFHVFRKEATKDSFAVRNVKFYDPLGIGFEILTSGHIFRLNFTNAHQILENRFIPSTTNSWGKGQFRWCFTISRTFNLKR